VCGMVGWEEEMGGWGVRGGGFAGVREGGGGAG